MEASKQEKKLSPEQITLIINLIEANPQMTLLELSRELAFYWVPSVSLSTLSGYLNCELITMKRASFQHENNTALHNSIDSQKKKTIKTHFISMMTKLPAALGMLEL